MATVTSLEVAETSGDCPVGDSVVVRVGEGADALGAWLCLQPLGERARAVIVRRGLLSVGEGADPLVARERLLAACEVAVRPVLGTCLHVNPLFSSLVVTTHGPC